MDRKTRTFKAIDYLLERVTTDPWLPDGSLAVDWLLSQHPSLSRGEQATVEVALTLYNGGEYLGTTNVLRHIMEHTDTVYRHRILKALLYVGHHSQTLD